MIQLLPGLRIKEPYRHSTYGRVKLKTIHLFMGKYKVYQLYQCISLKKVAYISLYYYITY